MVTIITENIFVESAIIGDSFRPSNFAFICVYEGNLTVSVNELTNICTYGNLIFISPNNVYKIEGYSSDIKMFIFSLQREVIRSKINFKFSRYDVYQIAQLENKHVVKIDNSEFDNLTQLLFLAQFYKASYTKRKFANDIFTGIITSVIYLITEFLLAGNSSLQKKNFRKDEITIKFLDLVSKNFKENKELSFYAQSLLISVKYLSNCVREITKSPPTRFIADALMNEAKALLLNPDYTVGDIAAELGFSDQYAFGKFFKKHTAYSPTGYRKHNSLKDTFL